MGRSCIMLIMHSLFIYVLNRNRSQHRLYGCGSIINMCLVCFSFIACKDTNGNCLGLNEEIEENCFLYRCQQGSKNMELSIVGGGKLLKITNL